MKKLLVIILLHCFYHHTYSQVQIFNPKGTEDSFIGSVMETNDGYLIAGNTRYNNPLIWNSFLHKLDKNLNIISSDTFSDYIVSYDETLITFNQKNKLVFSASNDYDYGIYIIEYDILSKEKKVITYIKEFHDSYFGNIFKINDSILMVGIYHGNFNFNPDIAVINRNTGSYTIWHDTGNFPYFLSFNLDSSEFIVKGLNQITVTSNDYTVKKHKLIDRNYGNYSGDIFPDHRINKMVYMGAIELNKNFSSTIDTIDVGIGFLDQNYNVTKLVTYGKKGDTVDIPALDVSKAFTIDGYYIGSTSGWDRDNYPWGRFATWFCVTKMDTALNILWQRYYGGDANYFMHGIIGTADGGVLAYGSRADISIDFRNRDMFFIKYDKDGLISFTKEIKSNHRDYNLYPNPCHESITLSNPFDIDCSVQIIDANGKIINSLIPITSQSEVNITLPELSNGIYFAHFFIKNKLVAVKKFVKI